MTMMKASWSVPYSISRWCSNGLNKHTFNSSVHLNSCKNTATIPRSLSSTTFPLQNGLTPEGEVVATGKHENIVPQHEVVRFPSSNKTKMSVSSAATTPTTTGVNELEQSIPVLLNSKEHAVGYLSKILNARVYDAAIETELQEAKNLSSVRYQTN